MTTLIPFFTSIKNKVSSVLNSGMLAPDIYVNQLSDDWLKEIDAITARTAQAEDNKLLLAGALAVGVYILYKGVK